MEQEQTPQVIYFKDLVFAALYQWRNILIAALVLALALGGMQAFRASRNSAAPQTVISAETAAEIAELKAKLEKTQASIDTLQAYLEESTLINMDPYQVYEASADIYVRTDYQILPDMVYQNPDKRPAILRSYQTRLRSNEALQSAAAAANIQAKYLAELVTITVASGTNDTLNLTVIYPNAEGAQQILGALIRHAEASTDQIAQNIAAHSISITSSFTDARTNANLVKLQTDTTARLDTLNNTLETTQTALNKLQAAPVPVTYKSPVLLAIVGAVLGAVIVVGIAWVRHIGSNKVYSARTLKNRTGIRILGCVPGSGKRDPINSWLRKLEGRNLNSDQLAVIAAAISNYCADEEQLLIMGQCDAKALEPLMHALKDAGIRAAACGSPLRSVQAVQALPGCSAVVLVEQCALSGYEQVAQAMEIVQDHGKRLLGCVLLDG